MTTTSTPHDLAPTATAATDWRRVAVRLSVGAGAATVAVLLLLVFFAWIAVHVPWKVPDRASIARPSVVLDRQGRELTRFTAQVDRRVVELDQVSTAARNAVIASEDVRFYEHTGVDPVSLLRAVVTNIRTGGITQGGSTLTQQYVKNAYLSPERSLVRKVREAVISIALERRLSKDQILENYLNEVYFGEYAWGIEAAALTYYGVSASELDAGQGATLAQLLPAPSIRNPRVDPQGARVRRNGVLDTMVAEGMISRATAEREKAEGLGLAPPPERKEDGSSVFREYVRRQLFAVYGEKRVLTQGLEVTTTLDRKVQKALRRAVAEHLPPAEAGHVEAAAVAIDPDTGAILGLYPGRGFGPQSQIDLSTQYRPPAASTFKPFVYLTALQQGMLPTDVYPAPSAIRPDDCPKLPDGSNPFKQAVQNAGGVGYGRLQLQDALANSVNTVFAQLGCDVGADNIVETADWLGVRTPIEPVPLVSLGSPPLGPTVLDMASAYATLANDGVHCPAHAIQRVVSRRGEKLPRPDEVVLALQADRVPRRHPDQRLADRPAELEQRDAKGCYGVADADRVRSMTQTLTRVPNETTGTRADIGRPQAGKTGTADDETFAWYVGYTPDIAIAVHVSDPLREAERLEAGEGRKPMRDVAGFDRVYGGTIPALIWKSAAEAILADVPPSDFPEPGELVDEDSIVGPARPKPRRTVAPSDEPSADDETSAPTDPPSDQPPSDEPSSGPSSDPDQDPGDGNDEDDEECFLVFCG